MSSVTDGIDRLQLIELRHQAHYWRAQHARAVQREAQCKDKAQQLQARIGQLEATIAQLRQQQAQQEAQIKKQNQQIEALKARVIELAGQVFGRRTEATDESTSPGHDPAQNTTDGQSDEACGDDSSQPPPADRRKRGQQPGATGHGRKRHVNLPCVEEVHEFPEAARRCFQCGKPFRPFPGTENSEEIEWEVILRRRVHKRRRYQPTCDC